MESRAQAIRGLARLLAERVAAEILSEHAAAAAPASGVNSAGSDEPALNNPAGTPAAQDSQRTHYAKP
ncbi:MAG TPA: hypothetical protein VN750_10020 [Steroidobacteraceae bacterium]|nr:hypothetical protein [Steroidobacteraceae bacterium]